MKANKSLDKIIEEWKAKRLKKLGCNTCPYKTEEIKVCEDCQEQDDQEQDMITKMEIHYDCDKCGRMWRDMMEENCEECGDGLFWEDQEICLLGLDVVALFPSMTSLARSSASMCSRALSRSRGSTGNREPDMWY